MNQRARLPLLHPGAIGRPVQSWARAAAWGCLIAVLPSILWRIGMLVGLPLGFAGTDLYRGSTDGTVYVLALEAAELLGGLLCVGLAQRWGEVIPGWVPGLGGRTIHRLIPTLVGSLAAALLFLILGQLLVRFSGTWFFGADNWTPDAGMSVWQRVVLAVAYVPLFFWPVLLTIALVGYWRRRAPGVS